MPIQINLVPENLRKKKKVPLAFVKGFQLPREVVIGLVGGLIGLLVFVHVSLQVGIVVQYVRLHRYHQMKKNLAGKKVEADRVVQELRKIQGSLKLIDDISSSRRVYWASKLNAISDSMTRGVWLENLAVEGKLLTLNGSGVSKAAAEMLEVNSFITKLKANPTFSKGFGRVEAGTPKMRKVNTTPVADFSLTATLK